MNRVVKILPWLLFVGSALAMGIGRFVELVVLESPVEFEGSNVLAEIGMALGFLAFPAVGALVASRQPNNAIGWLLCAVGLLAGLGVLSMAWSRFALQGGRHAFGATTAAWVATWFWYPLISIISTFLLLLFPTGHLPSRRWRPVAWSAGTVIAIVTIAPMLQEWLVVDNDRIRNPVGVIAGDVEKHLEPAFLVLVPIVVLCAASLVVRFVRGRKHERQQLKWVAFAAVMFPPIIFVGDVVGLPEFVFAMALIMLPAAIGVAILKYRLYDIDVIINRALVYAVLTAVIVATYAGGVLLFRTVLDPITGDNDIAIAASTLAVAALFGPARRRIQAFIDRRFYRARYDAQQTLEAFATRLRNEVELDRLAGDLVVVVTETVQPSHVSVLLLEEEPA